MLSQRKSLNLDSNNKILLIAKRINFMKKIGSFLKEIITLIFLKWYTFFLIGYCICKLQ